MHQARGPVVLTTLRDRAFLIGLAIRVAALAAVTPLTHLVPNDTGAGTADSAFGVPPLVIQLLGQRLGAATGFPGLGLGLAVLAADIGVFIMLGISGSSERRREVAYIYWSSPLVI